MALSENKQKMRRGELYHCWTPELIAERRHCHIACAAFNNVGDVSRRRITELWRNLIQDDTPLPPVNSDPEADDLLFDDDPLVYGPISMDYGYNVRVGTNVNINAGATFVDTCLISIGSRTLVAPQVSFYSGTHPLDPVLRNGTRGPEMGGEIHVGEDCWIGGNVVILPGVTIGKGATVGAGSVVTKDVPAFHVVAGNPARVLRRVETTMDPEYQGDKK